MRAVDSLGDRGAGRPVARADGDRRRGARRGGRAPRGRRARCGSSAARATTAATAWSPPAILPTPGTRSRCCCSGRPTSSRPTRPRTSSASTASVRELGAGEVGGGAGRLRGRSSTRSSAPASSGAPRDPAAAAIEAINDCGAPVVAADIASGVDASTGEVEGAAVEADLTVSFHAAKLGHWVAPGKRHTGELGWRRSGSPTAPPGGPAAGLIARRGARPAAAARRRLDQVQLRRGAGRRRLARAHRRRLHGRRARRSAPARATRRSPCRPSSSRSSR